MGRFQSDADTGASLAGRLGPGCPRGTRPRVRREPRPLRLAGNGHRRGASVAGAPRRAPPGRQGAAAGRVRHPSSLGPTERRGAGVRAPRGDGLALHGRPGRRPPGRRPVGHGRTVEPVRLTGAASTSMAGQGEGAARIAGRARGPPALRAAARVSGVRLGPLSGSGGRPSNGHRGGRAGRPSRARDAHATGRRRRNLDRCTRTMETSMDSTHEGTGRGSVARAVRRVGPGHRMRARRCQAWRMARTRARRVAGRSWRSASGGASLARRPMGLGVRRGPPWLWLAAIGWGLFCYVVGWAVVDPDWGGPATGLSGVQVSLPSR